MTSHVLKVTLAHIRPPIWRRLRVPSDISLPLLHDVLQVAFEWQDCHLHEFRVGRQCIGPLDREDAPDILDETALTLADVLPRKGDVLEYIYDLGDYWIHKVHVERIEPDEAARVRRGLRRSHGAASIICLAGERAAPPEDCGGPPGYAELLAALADAEHRQHAELRAWVGRDFDPEACSLIAINQRLAAHA